MPMHMLFEEPPETVEPLVSEPDVDVDENVWPAKVRSRGCIGISERESRVTLMFSGVVQGTQSVYRRRIGVSPM